MQELTKSQKARVAIRSFKTGVDAIGLRGYYRPKDLIGQVLADSLRTLSPEIYGSMNDPRVVELQGLEYVIERLPRGIECCNRIILTEEEAFEGTNFEKIEPPKRRRTSYLVSETEMCFVITRGLSEIYDIMTHLTFLTIEAQKIQERMRDESGRLTVEWKELEKVVQGRLPSGGDLDQALWNLSIILGRSFQQTRKTFENFEQGRQKHNSNAGLFALIYHLGRRIDEEKQHPENALIVYLTPALMNGIGHHKYGKPWAIAIKRKLIALGLADRPLHIISANLHSVVNLLYGPAALQAAGRQDAAGSVVDMVKLILEEKIDVCAAGACGGLTFVPDEAGTHVGCQIIDTARLDPEAAHPDLNLAPLREAAAAPPVILVMDYAFGVQAFELMENLLYPHWDNDHPHLFDIRSIAVMGKAGILSGNKGDIMLASAHVIEGTTDNYTVHNDLAPEDFGADIPVYTGPMLTVLGTSLQNRDVLRRIQRGWKAVGLEMEGGHYQRAINAAIIKGNIPPHTKTRYAYYASDNPLQSGQTLASGPMGLEGLAPTYRITKVLLEKILAEAA